MNIILKLVIISIIIIKTGYTLYASDYKNDHIFYKALRFVESKNLNTVGDNGKAIGVYQIHKIYIDDVNRIYGTKYSYDNRWDKNKSHEIVVLYLNYYRKVFERKYKRQITVIELAAIHNGGPQGYKKLKAREYGSRVLNYIKAVSQQKTHKKR